ncbi:SDR family NAD(P)-dependent oxidoreductase [Aureliella helgolandensis]|uniref:3-oxoacyl-[acyl-carrier-protein] reductase FabG n=1 Tax=Aureliella helgolandensis TaxID=2527968 RepID=A0A518GE14_9BACT|nr:SDR family oxidoreductase [Aureliella helgolandensis]QDV26788.1 3-oxoacyl-[acyl-carrier-protein] reductase FabG [Aureliella helgolandensis]
MDLGLAGHTALITGGANGIGLATAKAFAAEGCRLLLWDLATSVAVAEELADEFGVDVQSQQVDVANFNQCQSQLAEFIGSGRSIQHVVHCAAVGSGKFGFPFTKLNPEDWRKPVEVNILGMTNIAHVLTHYLTEQQVGTFVFVASVAGQIGSQTDPPYSASKAANINFAQCMAKDLACYGIRVNTVCPGMVQTALNRAVWQAWHNTALEGDKQSYEEWAARKLQSVVPLGRWQACEDIASMIVFLSSDRAMQVTGQTINVDGGQVMHS